MKDEAPAQLSDAEWELMKALWDQSPAAVSAVAARLNSSTGWHPKTVRTMLLRLEKKGIVNASTIDNILHYAPIYSREECSSSATQSFLTRVFDGALTPLVMNFTKQRPLSEKEKQALRRLLEE